MRLALLTKTITASLVILAPLAAVGEGTSTSTSTYGSSAASQTSSLPVYQSKGGASLNLQSTTTVSGGYQQSGNGNIIQSNNPGSQSSSSYGVGVKIPLPGGNK